MDSIDIIDLSSEEVETIIAEHGEIIFVNRGDNMVYKLSATLNNIFVMDDDEDKCRRKILTILIHRKEILWELCKDNA